MKIKLILLPILVSVMLAMFASPALATDTWYLSYTGQYLYCDYYGEEYWCWGPNSQRWLPGNIPVLLEQGWQLI